MSQIHATDHGGANELISAAVRGLIAQRRGIGAGEVALAAGVSRAALYRKLANASPWQADEVDRLSRFFRVSRDSLYEGRSEFTPDSSTADQKVGGSNPFGRALRSPGRRRGDRRRELTVLPLRPRHLRIVAAGKDEQIPA